MNEIEPDEISVRKVISKIKLAVKARRIFIISLSLTGMLIGLAYSIFKRPEYKAVSTFVLQETGKGGSMGLGQISSIASLAGIDFGTGSEKGLFQGDNIIELYRSRLMLEKTFLTSVEIGGKNQLLIDRYIKTNNLLERWRKHDHIETINFTGDPRNFSRMQDSLILDIIKYFRKHLLTVTKPDKKLSLINIEVKSEDELFAELFNERLVQTVNNFYIQTETKKELNNVRLLQHQADSVRLMLNNSIGSVAASTDATPNPNPTRKSLQVPYQKRQIDVQANGAIYTEIVKNLELAKITLRQETPLIQLIDEPLMPLESDRVGKLEGAAEGLAGGLLLSILLIVLSKIYYFFRNA